MAIAESTHWYKQDGSPQYTVIGKNGKERNATLRDARELNLVPSVTTILQVPAKPALTNWLIDQALLSALTLPKIEGESLDDFKARAKADSKEQVTEAADIGTSIHAEIEKGFKGELNKGQSVAFDGVLEWLDAAFPGTPWEAEQSFSSSLGFGGKLDLRGDIIFVDFKSKDGISGKDASKLVYDEHGMQLSAYAEGCGVSNPIRISCFIDRKTRDAKFHVWDEESHKKHWGMFKALLEYWKLSKGYNPEY